MPVPSQNLGGFMKGIADPHVDSVLDTAVDRAIFRGLSLCGYHMHPYAMEEGAGAVITT